MSKSNLNEKINKPVSGGRDVGDSEVVTDFTYIDADDFSICQISNADFIKWSEAIKGLSETDKIRFIYEHTNWVGLFDGIEVRIINGSSYEYGIKILGNRTARNIGWYYVECEKKRLLESYKTDLKTWFNKCNELSKKNFLEFEISKIKKCIDHHKDEDEINYFQLNEFAYGYYTELSQNIDWDFKYFLPLVFADINKTQFNKFLCRMVAVGAAYYHLELELLKIKDSLGKKSKEETGLKKTKLYYLLKLYYENERKPLTDTQVLSLAKENSYNEKVMANRFKILKEDNYSYGNNGQKRKEFYSVYKNLINLFESTNPTALNAVQKDYERLIEDYPNLST